MTPSCQRIIDCLLLLQSHQEHQEQDDTPDLCHAARCVVAATRQRHCIGHDSRSCYNTIMQQLSIVYQQVGRSCTKCRGTRRLNSHKVFQSYVYAFTTIFTNMRHFLALLLLLVAAVAGRQLLDANLLSEDPAPCGNRACAEDEHCCHVHRKIHGNYNMCVRRNETCHVQKHRGHCTCPNDASPAVVDAGRHLSEGALTGTFCLDCLKRGLCCDCISTNTSKAPYCRCNFCLAEGGRAGDSKNTSLGQANLNHASALAAPTPDTAADNTTTAELCNPLLCSPGETCCPQPGGHMCVQQGEQCPRNSTAVGNKPAKNCPPRCFL